MFINADWSTDPSLYIQPPQLMVAQQAENRTAQNRRLTIREGNLLEGNKDIAGFVRLSHSNRNTKAAYQATLTVLTDLSHTFPFSNQPTETIISYHESQLVEAMYSNAKNIETNLFSIVHESRNGIDLFYLLLTRQKTELFPDSMQVYKAPLLITKTGGLELFINGEVYTIGCLPYQPVSAALDKLVHKTLAESGGLKTQTFQKFG